MTSLKLALYFKPGVSLTTLLLNMKHDIYKLLLLLLLLLLLSFKPGVSLTTA